ncbi:MAG: DNA alkylation repair protein [Patescibacteria group bacterium]|jgi:3-methyladenine DNA glycosylase AlkD
MTKRMMRTAGANRLSSIRQLLRSYASATRARHSQHYFKTGPGDYGEGDVFMGVTVKVMRVIAKKFYKDATLSEILLLLHSPMHEERQVALFMLVAKFERGSGVEQKRIYTFYLKNTAYINNWDLVDMSASKIVGAYLSARTKAPLYALARSKNVWQRRIAIIATLQFIKNNQFRDTFKIARILLTSEHDLIHKAVGWMLREVGKRSISAEEDFLRRYYQRMPRTMLRYAIERFSEVKRRSYLKGLA